MCTVVPYCVEMSVCTCKNDVDFEPIIDMMVCDVTMQV